MTSAKKRTLIYNPPALLTLHLKRFEQVSYFSFNNRIHKTLIITALAVAPVLA